MCRVMPGGGGGTDQTHLSKMLGTPLPQVKPQVECEFGESVIFPPRSSQAIGAGQRQMPRQTIAVLSFPNTFRSPPTPNNGAPSHRRRYPDLTGQKPRRAAPRGPPALSAPLNCGRRPCKNRRSVCRPARTLGTVLTGKWLTLP